MEEYQLKWIAVIAAVFVASTTVMDVAEKISAAGDTEAVMEHGYEQVLDSKGNVMWRPVGTYKSEL